MRLSCREPLRVSLLARLEEQARRNAMGYSERFEYDAERFYRETGFMAPGKSMPMEMYTGEGQQAEREAAWSAWTQKLRDDFQELLASCAALLRDEEAQ